MKCTIAGFPIEGSSDAAYGRERQAGRHGRQSVSMQREVTVDERIPTLLHCS